ncbi:hypothetical protein [Paraburkholderia sp. CI3]|uniref:hypothetical protein n=1 Tax=Paraburkholderia sp. CI3 TaxID=2991060 RepID=UPI003D20D534
MFKPGPDSSEFKPSPDRSKFRLSTYEYRPPAAKPEVKRPPSPPTLKKNLATENPSPLRPPKLKAPPTGTNQSHHSTAKMFMNAAALGFLKDLPSKDELFNALASSENKNDGTFLRLLEQGTRAPRWPFRSVTTALSIGTKILGSSGYCGIVDLHPELAGPLDKLKQMHDKSRTDNKTDEDAELYKRLIQLGNPSTAIGRHEEKKYSVAEFKKFNKILDTAATNLQEIVSVLERSSPGRALDPRRHPQHARHEARTPGTHRNDDRGK